MTEETKRRGLGRGLSALLEEDAGDYTTLDRLRPAKEIPIEAIQPNRDQPRRRFDEAELESLADSIRANGILQPILVRRLDDSDSSFEIIAGERRWRAAQLCGVHNIPVVIRDIKESETVELALIENIQREDLTPLEEAEAFQHLIAEYGQTQDEISAMIGKSRSHVANMVRLLSLPELVRDMLQDGRLSAGHARALVGQDDAETLAKRIVAGGLNVRQAEQLTRPKQVKPSLAPAPAPVQSDANSRALEQGLTQALGLRVEVKHQGEIGGEVRIRYKTLEQLEEICHRLSQGDEPI